MMGAENNSAEPSIVVMQYETLRRAGLGDALPPEARSGLMLFLRRGMWGWARSATSAPPQLARFPLSNWRMPEEYRTLIHIFAAMAIKATTEE
jgi:hypothetical protein